MLHRLAVLSIQVGLAGCGSACGARWRSCCPQTGLGRSLVRTRPSSGGQAVLVREDRAVLGEGGGGDRGDGEVKVPREGQDQFPPDRRPANSLADACCCASMQRSVASADIIVMEGWGRKG